MKKIDQLGWRQKVEKKMTPFFDLISEGWSKKRANFRSTISDRKWKVESGKLKVESATFQIEKARTWKSEARKGKILDLNKWKCVGKW